MALRRLLDYIPAELGILDLNGRFLFNTPEGIQDATMRDWIIGKNHYEYATRRKLPKSFAANRQNQIDKCIRTRRLVTFEESMVDRVGQRRTYLRMFTPVLDRDGQVTHVVGHGQEITALKTTEEQLRKALTELEQLKGRLELENRYLNEEIKSAYDSEEIVGRSPAFKKVLKQVEQVAATDAAALIQGETGTGKELLARALHRNSARRKRALIRVNCAALPANLIESELFGHEKGAFTGAVTSRVGRFQLADSGTIFLDEVGDLPLALQPKLLRVLQEGEFEPLGDSRTRRVDVRVISATNRDLQKAVADGSFREDLYYRLNVVPIQSPPLRERREDIPLLAENFVRKYATKLGKSVPRLTPRIQKKLETYDWPGNVRELKNVIERAVVLSRGQLRLTDWPELPRKKSQDALLSLRENDRQHILLALKRTGGKVSGPDGAAELLQINASTLDARLRKLGIK